MTNADSASQPDIEDLIKKEASDAIECDLKYSCTLHEVVRHDFRPSELLAIRTELLKWYDANRRKLPWRGDPPPYLTTATHTSRTKANSCASKKIGLDAFMKMPQVQQEEVNKAGSITEDKNEAKSRQVTPYETWVSEIMLQQTRVDTVVDYFSRWIDKFPTVTALAEASEDEVNALWAGLGYYRRAKMLHAGAKYVVKNYKGELPPTVDQLLAIPGIGPYTAGAIASIAFGQRKPLVDGNVIRVIARMRAVGADPKNKQLINFTWKAADELVGECDRPGALNQALMELGATMCTVQNPLCTDCPVKSLCLAYEEKDGVKANSKFVTSSQATDKLSTTCSICDYTRIAEWDKPPTDVTRYPLKAKKNDSKEEVICVTVVSSSAEALQTSARGKRRTTKSSENTPPSDWKFLMFKRPEGGLLAGQWEFLHSKMSDGNKIPPYSKRKTFMDTRLLDILDKSMLSESGDASHQRREVGELTHIFSHVKHYMGIEHLHFTCEPELMPAAKSAGLRWLSIAEMQQLGITTGVKKILQLVLSVVSGRCKTSSVKSSKKRLKTIASFFKK